MRQGGRGFPPLQTKTYFTGCETDAVAWCKKTDSFWAAWRIAR